VVAGAFGAGALDDAAAVHPDASVRDAPGLDRHRGAEPHSGCEFPPEQRRNAESLIDGFLVLPAISR
jgi:hypothetical protein